MARVIECRIWAVTLRLSHDSVSRVSMALWASWSARLSTARRTWMVAAASMPRSAKAKKRIRQPQNGCAIRVHVPCQLAPLILGALGQNCMGRGGSPKSCARVRPLGVAGVPGAGPACSALLAEGKPSPSLGGIGEILRTGKRRPGTAVYRHATSPHHGPIIEDWA